MQLEARKVHIVRGRGGVKTVEYPRKFCGVAWIDSAFFTIMKESFNAFMLKGPYHLLLG